MRNLKHEMKNERMVVKERKKTKQWTNHEILHNLLQCRNNKETGKENK